MSSTWENNMGFVSTKKKLQLHQFEIHIGKYSPESAIPVEMSTNHNDKAIDTVKSNLSKKLVHFQFTTTRKNTLVLIDLFITFI